MIDALTLLAYWMGAAAVVVALWAHLMSKNRQRKAEELERITRFVHWASSHERGDRLAVCGCVHCEQMRRDFGLPETWRWRKWTIPSRYT